MQYYHPTRTGVCVPAEIKTIYRKSEDLQRFGFFCLKNAHGNAILKTVNKDSLCAGLSPFYGLLRIQSLHRIGGFIVGNKFALQSENVYKSGLLMFVGFTDSVALGGMAR